MTFNTFFRTTTNKYPYLHVVTVIDNKDNNVFQFVREHVLMVIVQHLKYVAVSRVSNKTRTINTNAIHLAPVTVSTQNV